VKLLEVEALYADESAMSKSSIRIPIISSADLNQIPFHLIPTSI